MVTVSVLLYICSLGDLPSFWDSMRGFSYTRMSVNLFQTCIVTSRKTIFKFRCITNYFQFVYYGGPCTF